MATTNKAMAARVAKQDRQDRGQAKPRRDDNYESIVIDDGQEIDTTQLFGKEMV